MSTYNNSICNERYVEASISGTVRSSSLIMALVNRCVFFPCIDETGEVFEREDFIFASNTNFCRSFVVSYRNARFVALMSFVRKNRRDYFGTATCRRGTDPSCSIIAGNTSFVVYVLTSFIIVLIDYGNVIILNMEI